MSDHLDDVSVEDVEERLTTLVDEYKVPMDEARRSVTNHYLEEAGLELTDGTTVPADEGSLYAKGCLFIDTDVATGTTGLYCNKGTAASCVFTAVTQA